MKTAAAYLRVSTDKQDEYSLDSQLKLIRDYAAKNGFLIPDEYVFVDDGISGRSAKKRPGRYQHPERRYAKPPKSIKTKGFLHPFIVSHGAHLFHPQNGMYPSTEDRYL